MSDRLSKKLADTFASQGEAGSDPDAADDLGCFGLLRGVRERAQMLTLQKASGDRLAVAYACIDRIEFNPSDNAITLHGVGKEIRIRGTLLAAGANASVSMFDALARHRVPWISEAGQAQQLAMGGKTCVVSSIAW